MTKPMIEELTMEAASTKRVLERLPEDKQDWKPHERSMPLGRLAAHVAHIPTWISMITKTDELNLANMEYKPFQYAKNDELLAFQDKNIQDAATDLSNTTDEDMMKIWTLRNGDHIIFQLPKAVAIRSMALNHIVHHRAQLSTYLRQNDIPVPGLYGPSADERN